MTTATSVGDAAEITACCRSSAPLAISSTFRPCRTSAHRPRRTAASAPRQQSAEKAWRPACRVGSVGVPRHAVTREPMRRVECMNAANETVERLPLTGPLCDEHRQRLLDVEDWEPHGSQPTPDGSAPPMVLRGSARIAEPVRLVGASNADQCSRSSRSPSLWRRHHAQPSAQPARLAPRQWRRQVFRDRKSRMPIAADRLQVDPLPESKGMQRVSAAGAG